MNLAPLPKAHRCRELVQLNDGRYVVRCTCSTHFNAELSPIDAMNHWGAHLWAVAFTHFPQPTLPGL